MRKRLLQFVSLDVVFLLKALNKFVKYDFDKTQEGVDGPFEYVEEV